MADTQLAIRQEDITQITAQAPESFNLNRLSHDKCLAYGEDLLRYIEQNGMNEENDNRLNDYIKKCRATVKAMNDRRTPVTQLFDRFRNLYTTMENGISPSTPGTPANRAQKMRDDFARKKHEEAERARKEAERQQRIAQARNSYKEDCERELFNFFNTRTNQAINRISELNRSIELSTFDATAAEIQAFDCSFPVEDIARYTFGVMIPSCMELKECQEIQKSVLEKAKAMADQYRFDVSEYRDTVTASLPSKFNELKAVLGFDGKQRSVLCMPCHIHDCINRCTVRGAESVCIHMRKQGIDQWFDFSIERIAVAIEKQPVLIAVKTRIIDSKCIEKPVVPGVFLRFFI